MTDPGPRRCMIVLCHCRARRPCGVASIAGAPPENVEIAGTAYVRTGRRSDAGWPVYVERGAPRATPGGA